MNRSRLFATYGVTSAARHIDASPGYMAITSFKCRHGCLALFECHEALA